LLARLRGWLLNRTKLLPGLRKIRLAAADAEAEAADVVAPVGAK